MLLKKKQTQEQKFKRDDSLIRTMHYLRPIILKTQTEDPQELVKLTIKDNKYMLADIKWGVITKRTVIKNLGRFIKVATYDPQIIKEAEHGPGYLAYCIQRTERIMKKPEFEPLP